MFKHQNNCYRTIHGVKYYNACDLICEDSDAMVERTKALKLRHRIVKHTDGFEQLFIHPDDFDKLAI